MEETIRIMKHFGIDEQRYAVVDTYGDDNYDFWGYQIVEINKE